MAAPTARLCHVQDSTRFQGARWAYPRGRPHDYGRVFNISPTRCRLKTVRRVFLKIPVGALTMTTHHAAASAGIAAPRGYVPPHYLNRVARSIILRAALRGRLSWCVALPLLASISGQEVQP
jgi:hypothetical protein